MNLSCRNIEEALYRVSVPELHKKPEAVYKLLNVQGMMLRENAAMMILRDHRLATREYFM